MNIAPNEPLGEDALRASLLQFKNLIENGRAKPTPTTDTDGNQSVVGLPTSDDLEHELDSVLALYQPTIAEDQWEEIIKFRAGFLANAQSNPNKRHIFEKLRTFRFTSRLMSTERVERNSARADAVTSELNKLL
jgi:hypothetical protein